MSWLRSRLPQSAVYRERFRIEKRGDPSIFRTEIGNLREFALTYGR
jgi:hypothetical protein